MRGFTMRFGGEDGDMTELVFGPGEETDASTPPTPTSVTWPSRDTTPRRARRKRPRKTHGKNKKKRKRRR
jgi:hypothetical protein